jgi:hypothetical protein
MNWNDIGAIVKPLAPMLGAALGGPLGGVAGQILAAALGASEPTPDAVGTVIAAKGVDAGETVAALRRAQTEFADALAQIGKAQVEQVGATQRAEMAATDAVQRWWRPLYALELSLIECPAFTLTLLHGLWTGFEPTIAGFGNLSGLLMAYFGARFSVLGVYVTGRTREKQSTATGEAVPGLIAELTRTLSKKK